MPSLQFSRCHVTEHDIAACKALQINQDMRFAGLATTIIAVVTFQGVTLAPSRFRLLYHSGRLARLLGRADAFFALALVAEVAICAVLSLRAGMLKPEKTWRAIASSVLATSNGD